MVLQPHFIPRYTNNILQKSTLKYVGGCMNFLREFNSSLGVKRVLRLARWGIEKRIA